MILKRVIPVLCSLLVFFSVCGAEVKTFDVHSPSMAKDVKVNVVFPDSYAADPARRYPVVYLLHGAGDDHTAWVKNAPSVPKEADLKDFIVICPSVGLSWYYDSPVDDSIKFETFCARELPAWADANLRTVKDRSGRATCGLSMGGHGAMWLAVRNRDQFGTAVALSGGVDVRPFDGWNLPNLLGDKKADAGNWENGAVINAVKTLKNGDIAISIDCGVDDFFMPVNRNLHSELLKMKIDHDYTERPGAHQWSYWEKVFPYAAVFMDKQFRKSAAPASK